jgi:hypothetical protein
VLAADRGREGSRILVDIAWAVTNTIWVMMLVPTLELTGRLVAQGVQLAGIRRG